MLLSPVKSRHERNWLHFNFLFGGAIKQANYTTFRHHSVVIEDRYKPMSEMKNKYTLVGCSL